MTISEKEQLVLLANVAKLLKASSVDIHFKTDKLNLCVSGESSLGGVLMIIDYLITDMMEDGNLEFEEIIMLLSAVRTVTLDKEEIKE